MTGHWPPVPVYEPFLNALATGVAFPSGPRDEPLASGDKVACEAAPAEPVDRRLRVRFHGRYSARLNRRRLEALGKKCTAVRFS